jgi:hypothetical protein
MHVIIDAAKISFFAVAFENILEKVPILGVGLPQKVTQSRERDSKIFDFSQTFFVV